MNKVKYFCKVTVLYVLVVLGGVAIPITSQAQEVSMFVEPRMTYISTYSTNLTISDSGVATVTGLVRGKTGVTNTYVKVTLQKSIAGTWRDVESWEESNDSRSTTISETYQVSAGTYRVLMTCSAETETKTATSASRTY